jgi:hypothetical protein
VCPVFFWNCLRHVRPPRGVWLFENGKQRSRVWPTSNDGDTFFDGGKKVAETMGLLVPTAVRIENLGDNFLYLVEPLGEYVVDGAENLRTYQPGGPSRGIGGGKCN